MVPNHQPDSNLPPFDPSSSPHRHVTQRGCDSTWSWQVGAHSSLRQGGELNLTLVVSTCSTPKWTIEEVEAWTILVQPGFWPSNIGLLNGLVMFSQFWPSTMGDQRDHSATILLGEFCWEISSEFETVACPVTFSRDFLHLSAVPIHPVTGSSTHRSVKTRGQGVGKFLEFHWWKVHKQK
jgi:hypothetical protein